MVDIYSKEYYISIGLSEHESIERVIQNKLYTGIGLRRSLANKRISKYKFIGDISSDELIVIEDSIFSIKNSTRNLVKLYKILGDLIIERNLSFESAVSYYKEVLLKYNYALQPNKHSEFIKDLYGENSPQYIHKLGVNAKYASCSFDKFSKSYDDKELARLDFNAIYGSNNICGIMSRHNISEEDAKSIVRDRIYNMNITNNDKPYDVKLEINKSKGLSLTNCIKKYGDILGEIKFKERCDSRKGMSSLDFYIKKYGDDEGAKIFKETRGRHKVYYCVEYWIEKGHTKESAADIIHKLMRERPNFSLDFCVEKYGKSKGYIIWENRQILWQDTINSKSAEELADINSRKGLSLSNLIVKYGLEVGTEKYNTYNINRVNSIGYSISGRNFFIKIYKKLRKLGIIERHDVYFGINGSKEYFLRNSEKIRFFDFTIPKLKYMVEFNGCVFHPREFDFTWKSAFGVSYEKTFENDTFKYKLATDAGYTLDYVWDDEDLDAAHNNIIMKIFELYEEYSA